MDIERIRTYCWKKKGRITEGEPFGEGVLVFKVEGKMFLLANLNDFPATVNLKCDPALAIDIRERYESVTPGYHMNKKHWNTVVLNGGVPSQEILKMIDHSYELVVGSLGKSISEKLLAKQGKQRTKR
ncbi:MAG: MmcQ/YjbR family DNA-binding protein [Bacteroidota bacterium]